MFTSALQQSSTKEATSPFKPHRFPIKSKQKVRGVSREFGFRVGVGEKSITIYSNAKDKSKR
jgi:hypothetical protein